MKNRYKILIVAYLLSFLVFGVGITYSIFHSKTSLEGEAKNVAKFIFGQKGLDTLSIPLIYLVPNVLKEYPFSISNNDDINTSNVTIEYKLLLKTYHFAPLDIKLYEVTDNGDNLVISCDETAIRNASNELVCESDIKTLGHSNLGVDNYRLDVKFEDGYDSDIYSNIVDYINIEIKSWQKTGK